MQNLAKIAFSTSSGVRAPVISSSAAPRLVQIRPARTPPDVPAARRVARRATSPPRVLEQPTCRRLVTAGDRATARRRAAPVSARRKRIEPFAGPRRHRHRPAIRPRPTPARQVALFATTTRASSRTSRRAAPDRRRSAASSGRAPARSAAALARRDRARDALGLDRIARLARTPAVSTSVIGTPSTSIVSVSRSRVVPGTSATIARPAPASCVEQARFAGVRPPDDRDMQRLRESAGRARRVAQQRDRSRSTRVELAHRLARLDEVIALVGKVQRRFELRASDRTAARRSRAIALGQRAVELIERRRACSGVTASIRSRDGFGLHQIDPSVQIRAQREFAWLGEPRCRRPSPPRTIARSSTGLPCALISTTSSPV